MIMSIINIFIASAGDGKRERERDIIRRRTTGELGGKKRVY